jgi:hypothetical protein
LYKGAIEALGGMIWYVPLVFAYRPYLTRFWFQ